MQQLNRNSINKPKTLPLKIIQFGGGNFLRAFVDWMVQILNETTDFNSGVVVVKPTKQGDYHLLKSQNGLFTVALAGFKNGQLIAEKKLIACVQEIVNPYSEWENYLALAENIDLRFVVSNTTEAGIKFNAEDQLEDKPPIEFPAKLTLWLYHRFQYFKGDTAKGCIVLPCELIEENGVALKNTILQYADHWKLEDPFKTWINSSNHFCNTLVDRIVSGYPADRADEIVKELGYTDDLLVAGEYYHSWVIQCNEVVQKELPFDRTDLNVEFVDDLRPYREMKVRILNGAHTTLVPVAYLAGIRFVNDAMNNREVSRFVELLLQEEVSKTLNFSESVIRKFIDDVLDRFRNPLLKHQLISISLNSTSKFVTRLLPTLKDYYSKEGKLPKKIVFGFSALIRFYKGEFNGEKIETNDHQKVLDFFQSAYQKLDSQELSKREVIALILGNSDIWGEDLSKVDGLTALVQHYFIKIENEGVLSCLKEELSP